MLTPGKRFQLKEAATAMRIVLGTLQLHLNSRLGLFLAILAGLLASGSALCGGDPRFELESLRWIGTPRWVPQWTPDGNHIVFDGHGRGKSNDIYIVRSDGSELKRISASSGDYDIDSWPDISPDGSRVVYITSRHRFKGERKFEIETAKLDGSDRHRLTDNSVHDLYPTWSPDGAHIAFSRRNDQENLIVIAADGSDERTVFDAQTVDPGTLDLEDGSFITGMRARTCPVWSPDGEMVAFIGSTGVMGVIDKSVGPENPSTRIDTLSVLYTVGWDGQGLTPLFSAGSVDGFIPRGLAWSPDGRNITFMHYDRATEEWGLYAVGRDGAGLRKLAESHAESGSMSEAWTIHLYWSPRGDEVRFVMDGHLYVAKADGSGYRREATRPVEPWNPLMPLSPDGSRIAVVGGSGFHLATIAADGSDERRLVLRYTDGSLRAANPENKKCFVWICW